MPPGVGDSGRGRNQIRASSHRRASACQHRYLILSAGIETFAENAIGASCLEEEYPAEPLRSLRYPLRRVISTVRYDVAAKIREGDGAFVYFSEKHSS